MIGCGAGCLVVLLLIAITLFFAWTQIRNAIQSMSGGSQTSFQQSSSPDGARSLVLERPAGGIQPLYYRVTVTTVATGATCTAASVVGLRAERYVHPIWSGPTAILVRYGVYQNGSGSVGEATAATGTGACTDVTVTMTHDPLLDAEATAANTGAAAGGSSDGNGGKGGTTINPAPTPFPAPNQFPAPGGDGGTSDGGQGGDVPSGKP